MCHTTTVQCMWGWLFVVMSFFFFCICVSESWSTITSPRSPKVGCMAYACCVFYGSARILSASFYQTPGSFAKSWRSCESVCFIDKRVSTFFVSPRLGNLFCVVREVTVIMLLLPLPVAQTDMQDVFFFFFPSS